MDSSFNPAKLPLMGIAAQDQNIITISEIPTGNTISTTLSNTESTGQQNGTRITDLPAEVAAVIAKFCTQVQRGEDNTAKDNHEFMTETMCSVAMAIPIHLSHEFQRAHLVHEMNSETKRPLAYALVWDDLHMLERLRSYGCDIIQPIGTCTDIADFKPPSHLVDAGNLAWEKVMWIRERAHRTYNSFNITVLCLATIFNSIQVTEYLLCLPTPPKLGDKSQHSCSMQDHNRNFCIGNLDPPCLAMQNSFWVLAKMFFAHKDTGNTGLSQPEWKKIGQIALVTAVRTNRFDIVDWIVDWLLIEGRLGRFDARYIISGWPLDSSTYALYGLILQLQADLVARLWKAGATITLETSDSGPICHACKVSHLSSPKRLPAKVVEERFRQTITVILDKFPHYHPDIYEAVSFLGRSRVTPLIKNQTINFRELADFLLAQTRRPTDKAMLRVMRSRMARALIYCVQTFNTEALDLLLDHAAKNKLRPAITAMLPKLFEYPPFNGEVGDARRCFKAEKGIWIMRNMQLQGTGMHQFGPKSRVSQEGIVGVEILRTICAHRGPVDKWLGGIFWKFWRYIVGELATERANIEYRAAAEEYNRAVLHRRRTGVRVGTLAKPQRAVVGTGPMWRCPQEDAEDGDANGGNDTGRRIEMSFEEILLLSSDPPAHRIYARDH